MSTILLLGDITGRSRVAVRMMTAALEAQGNEVLALPTALISNTLNLGAHQALDTTDYLLRSLETWERLGIAYDGVCIGYITGTAQAGALCAIADGARKRGAWVLVDPILGDNGRMYRSVTEDQAEGMCLLCAHADLVTPNLTEACLLAGVPYEAALCGGQALWEAVDSLSAGGRSVLITSARTEDGRDAVVGFDARRETRVIVPFERAGGQRGGTGDLFCALLADALGRGQTLERAAREASRRVGAQLRGEEASLLPQL